MSVSDNVSDKIEFTCQSEMPNYVLSLVANQVEKTVESKFQSIAEKKWKTLTEISDKQKRLESTLEECCKEMRELSENIRSLKDSFDEMKTDIESFKNKNRENAIMCQTFEDKLKLTFDKLNEVEQNMTEVNKKLSSPKVETPEKGHQSGQENKSTSLETRLSRLEVSIAKALDVMMPRVELLLSKINHNQSVNNNISNSYLPGIQQINSDSVDDSIKTGKGLKLSERNLPQSSQPSFSFVAGANKQTSNSPRWFCVSPKSRNCTISSLLNAAKSGRVDDVCALLDSGINVNESSEDKTTALHIAAEYGHVKLVELLLNRRANVNVVDCNGMTPILIAASNSHVKCLLILLHAGSNVNIVANDGRSVLHMVALNGDRISIEAVLSAGAVRNATNCEGWAALHWAAAWGSVETVETLLKNGFAPSITNRLGMTPLHLAVVNGREDTAHLLLMAGASFSEIRKGYMTPAEVTSCDKVLKNLRVLMRDKCGGKSGNRAGEGLPNGGFVTVKKKRGKC